MRMRDEDQMQYLGDMERRIRASEFWRGKPKGAEAAIKRLYRTGAGDCGGADWRPDASPDAISVRLKAELAEERPFEAMWSTGIGEVNRLAAPSTSRTNTAGDPAFSLGEE
jgi:hypothetical protein